MAPYIPPALFSKRDLVQALIKFMINTVGRRYFEDNVERGDLKFSVIGAKVHAGLRKRYKLPPPVPRPAPPAPPVVPAKMQIINDLEVIAIWKAIKPDPEAVRAWHVRDTERRLKELDLHPNVDLETLEKDLDNDTGEAAYEAEVAEYQCNAEDE